MLFASQTEHMVQRLGLEDGIRSMMDAGYPALDLSVVTDYGYMFEDDWRERADSLRELAGSRGVIFHQAHAPFGGGYGHYTQVLAPQMPRIFAFVGRLGVRQIVVHPLQRGRYYGHEQELFNLNMDFYKELAPHAREAGIKIAIENMWQNHPVNHHICDDVCANPRELADYYDALNDPDTFTVCLDIGHVAICGREPEDAIRILGHDRLGALHVHDVDYANDLHTLPGCGAIKWDAVCRALADIRYEGCFTLEADTFLCRHDTEFLPVACKYMADTARHLAEKVDIYRGATVQG